MSTKYSVSYYTILGDSLTDTESLAHLINSHLFKPKYNEKTLYLNSFNIVTYFKFL